jgi:D-glycero-D-manno-heptose 1,7-bisphosphate phosphatase
MIKQGMGSQAMGPISVMESEHDDAGELLEVDLDGIYYCPHHPQGTVDEFRQTCDCRKPHPGMFISAQEFLHIDMASSYMVGDKLEDMQAAAAAGVGNKILVRTGKPVTPEAENAADWVINSLAELPQAIKKR